MLYDKNSEYINEVNTQRFLVCHRSHQHDTCFKSGVKKKKEQGASRVDANVKRSEGRLV